LVVSRNRLPANTRTIRFVTVKTSGNYNLTLDSRSARLKPGNYIAVVAGEVPPRKDLTLGYSFKAVPVSSSVALSKVDKGGFVQESISLTTGSIILG